jgi:hypothetical protein
MTTFEELLRPVTAPEARAFLRELVITSPAQIPAEVLDTPTTPEAAIVYALGEAEAGRSTDRAFFARSAARSTATAEYLRVISAESFSLPPKTTTFGTTDITLDNASSSFYGPFDAGQFITRNSVTKALYANAAPIAGIPGGTTGLVFGVIALVAGTGSNALPNEITELETPLAGVTVTNPAALIAQDQEEPAQLNGRIDAKIGSLGEPGARGWNTGATSTAFEAVAKNGPDDGGGCIRLDGSRIDVTRTQVLRDDLTGEITLYVADDDGPLITIDVDTVRETVQTYTEWLGVEVFVENSTVATITYSGTLTIVAKSTSASDVAILQAMAASLSSAARPLGVGEGPTLDYGKDALLDAGNAGLSTAFKLKSLVLSSPIADTVLADGEVAALVLGTITIVRV